MSDAKHTPGPWRAVRDEYVSRAHRMGAAAMWVDARPQEDLWIVEAGRASVLVGAEADARFIAAAPDMFKALEEAKSFVESIRFDETQSESELQMKCEAAERVIADALTKARGDR